MSRTRFLALLLVAKLSAAFLAWTVVRDRIKLGDTQDYLAGLYLVRDDPLSTAYLMSVAGAAFTSLFGYSFLANVPLLLMAWFGILKGTAALELSPRAWLLLFVLLLSPTFQLWTSIHSKEAVLNLCFGYLVFFVVSRHKGLPLSRFDRIAVPAFVATLVFFKPLFAGAVAWLLFFSTVGLRTRTPRLLSVAAVALPLMVLSLSAPSIARQLDPEVRDFHFHFSSRGDFTRVEREWAGTGEMLSQMPVGLVTSFVGPTLRESLDEPVMVPFFLEGVISLLMIAGLLLRATCSGSRVFVARLAMLGGFLLLLLVAHYPLGYFNAGSALRYKQAFYGAVVILLTAFAFDARLRLPRVPENLRSN